MRCQNCGGLMHIWHNGLELVYHCHCLESTNRRRVTWQERLRREWRKRRRAAA